MAEEYSWWRVWTESLNFGRRTDFRQAFVVLRVISGQWWIWNDDCIGCNADILFLVASMEVTSRFDFNSELRVAGSYCFFPRLTQKNFRKRNEGPWWNWQRNTVVDVNIPGRFVSEFSIWNLQFPCRFRCGMLMSHPRSLDSASAPLWEPHVPDCGSRISLVT